MAMAGSKRTKADTSRRNTSTGSKKNTSGNHGRATNKVTTGHGNKTAGTAAKKARQKRGTLSTAQKQNRIDKMNQYQDYQAFEMGITIFVIAMISLFLYLTFFQLAGKTGDVIGGLFFGFFGWFAWFLPMALIIGIIFFNINRGDRRVPRRMFSFGGIILSLLGLTDLVLGKQIISEYYVSNHVFHQDYFECMYMTCHDVISRGKFNGGLLGRWVGALFSCILGDVAAIIILIAILLFSMYLFYGVEMMAMIRKKNAYHQEMEEIYEQVKDEDTYQEPSYRVFHTSKEKPARRSAPNLEKVPKVQSFDLHQLNKRMERMEEVMEETLGKSVTSIVKEQKTEKKEEKAFVPKTEKKEKLLSPHMEEITRDTQDFAKKKESVEKKNTASTDEIPIYRNELAEKFGKKKNVTKAVKIQQIISEKEETEEIGSVLENYDIPVIVKEGIKVEPESILQEENSNTTGVEKEKETPQPIVESSDFVELEESVEAEATAIEEETGIEHGTIIEKEEIATDVEEDAVIKPMNSFAYKEEVTDVTPSYLKETEKEYKMQTSKPKTIPPTVSSHGKIGGENYVSKSETFNALNESKVSKEPDIPYQFPPLELLQEPKKNENAASDSELRQTALKLQETLRSFNVNVQMGPVTCGPTVTRYELFPEQGVRVNKITNLSDDLKLSLAAQSIRIEAPIPGKAAVGIEVPNPVPGMVCFRELLEGNTFQESKSDLTFAVGKDIAGKLIMADIGKMPHLLIAGATGSGKSVCINTLLMSILYKADPKDVKLIMIDPKVVELSVYNGIPHLFCPVVTDPKEAAAALNWAVREMTDRYEKFKEIGVRNIAGYNQKIKSVENAEQAGYVKMPYLVVIVDEFADLMMVASKEVEDAVCRLAQLARAAGIHLVLATQRPSVNVITGVIKANIPSRIAFSVSSAIDSRTILDKGGAEKLLGKGDMLFFPSGYTEPVRVQGAFISDEEVSAVVDFLRENNNCPEYNTEVTQIVEMQEEEATEDKKPANDRDEYFAEAGKFVIESDRAAAGQLQRRFSIGFNRAGRIIDQLHKAGVVGPAEGTKPRKVLMDMVQFEQLLSGGASFVSDKEMEAMSRELDEMTATMEE